MEGHLKSIFPVWSIKSQVKNGRYWVKVDDENLDGLFELLSNTMIGMKT